MDVIAVIGGVAVLSATAAVGAVVHESMHMIVLRAIGVPFEVDWLPGGSRGPFELGYLEPLATVTPGVVPPSTSIWGLRLAALSPFAMATPMVLVLAGLAADPLASSDPLLAGATIGWLSTAFPSPQDFSLCWEAKQVVLGEHGPA